MHILLISHYIHKHANIDTVLILNSCCNTRHLFEQHLQILLSGSSIYFYSFITTCRYICVLPLPPSCNIYCLTCQKCPISTFESGMLGANEVAKRAIIPQILKLHFVKSRIMKLPNQTENSDCFIDTKTSNICVNFSNH